MEGFEGVGDWAGQGFWVDVREWRSFGKEQLGDHFLLRFPDSLSQLLCHVVKLLHPIPTDPVLHKGLF